MGAVSGDSRALATAELRHDLGSAWNGRWQAVAFVDSAHVEVNKTVWVAGTNSALSGAGVGLNWAGPNHCLPLAGRVEDFCLQVSASCRAHKRNTAQRRCLLIDDRDRLVLLLLAGFEWRFSTPSERAQGTKPQQCKY